MFYLISKVMISSCYYSAYSKKYAFLSLILLITLLIAHVYSKFTEFEGNTSLSKITIKLHFISLIASCINHLDQI